MLGLLGGCLLLLALWPGAASGQELAWPMFRQNAQRTGASPLAGPATPEILWQQPMDGFAYASPAVGPAGRLYVSAGNEVLSFNPDGSRRWSLPVPIPDEADDDTLFASLISSPAVATDGTLFFGARDGQLHVVREAAGRPVDAPIGLTDDAWASPALTAADGRGVVISDLSGGLFRFQASDGTYVPSPNFPFVASTFEDLIASPALGADGTAYAGSSDFGLYAIASTGAVRWRAELGSEVLATPAVWQQDGVDRSVIVAAEAGRVQALNPATGAARWTQDLGTPVIASPAVAGGSVYVVTYSGEAVALDVETGAVQWQEQLDDTGDGVVSSPVLGAEGRLYIATLGGTLHALRVEDGTVAWSRALGGPIWASPAVGPEERLYVVVAGTLTEPSRLVAFGNAVFEIDQVPQQPAAGEPITVTIGADPVPSEASVFVRMGGAQDFVEVPMSPAEGGRIEAAIPASMVTIRGLEYYIRAVVGETVETYPTQNPAENPIVLRVQVEARASEGSFFPSRYQMTSIPVDLDDASLAAVFEASYGPYDPSTWRLARWNPSAGAYLEPPRLAAPPVPGTAYFLITRLGTPFTIGRGLSVDTGQPYEVLLAPGWNQVATPFAFPVAWRTVAAATPSGGDLGVATFDGSALRALTPTERDTLVLRPWSGVLVFNSAATTQPLRIPPVEAAASVATESEAVAGATLALRARLVGTDLVDDRNWIGFADTAAEGLDAQDVVEAPAFGPHVQLSIVGGPRPLARSIKPPSAQGATWTIALRRSPEVEAREVEVELLPEAGFPRDAEIALVDAERGHRLPLRDGRVRVTLPADGTARRLDVVVGTPAYVRAQHPEATEVPAAFALDQNYPNPFNPETVIRYDLPEAGPVRLEVVNALGQRVAVLVDGTREAGRHTVRWDGRDRLGQGVSSGVYLYRLTAGSFTATRSMLLLR